MTTQGRLSRKVQMKFASKGAQPESKITSKWKRVDDTNLGHVDFKDNQGNIEERSRKERK